MLVPRHSRRRWLVYLQPLRFLVCRNQEVQQQWPCLTKEAQRYIACFETLAQLALMRIAWTAEGQAARGLRMPSSTDNTAPEAGVNKLFTTACPLQIFVVAAWAYKHKWSVLASRIPGERNVAQPRLHIRFRQQAASSLLFSPA